MHDLMFRSIKIFILVLGSISFYRLEDKHFFLGYYMIFVAWCWNYVVLYFDNNNPVISYLNLIFYELFSLFGVIIVVYRFFKYIIYNLSLMDDLHTVVYYDPLTNLPNRNYLINHFKPNIKVKKYFASHVSVDVNSIFIRMDIDDFKLINDNLGHHIGDLLLIEIASRLKESIRTTDLVLRFSGDEFILVVSDKDNKIDIEAFMDRLINVIRKPYDLEGKEVFITCSFGVSFFNIASSNIDEVLRECDIAMYTAKSEGKNSYKIYNEKIDRLIINRFDMFNELKYAIKNNEFVVYYQAKASAVNNKVTGLEALVRWVHPIKGVIGPNNFIPLLEETGLIKEVDMIVFNEVCNQINKWKEQGLKPVNVSVNVSPLFFSDSSFITKIDEILASSNVDPRYVSIEITENVELTDVELTRQKINMLKSRHIKVYLDDFGRGYSSLNYLKNYPIDCLKIDKVFIDNIVNDEVDQTLVRALVSISNLLGITVVCEGVEQQSQLEVLKELGCHEYQGYLLNKPLPLKEIEDLIYHDALI
jgi:diguanylate cyclase (GGDEF)-like protein